MAAKKQQIGQREHARTQVVPTEVKGLLTRQLRDHQQPLLVWDVSTTGMGLWTSDQLALGERIKITIGQPYLLLVEAEVVWCEPHLGGEGFRCGVHVIHQDEKLTSLYRAFTEIHSTPVSELVDPI